MSNETIFTIALGIGIILVFVVVGIPAITGYIDGCGWKPQNIIEASYEFGERLGERRRERREKRKRPKVKVPKAQTRERDR